MRPLRFFSFLFLLACLSLPFNLFSNIKSKSEKKSKYPVVFNPGINVDGNASDWPSKYLFCNFDAKVFYATANDTCNLFLCIKVLDPSENMTLMKNGLTIYLDPQGKKKKNYFLNIKFKTEWSGEKSHNRSGNNNRNRVPPESHSPQNDVSSVPRTSQRSLPPQDLHKPLPVMKNSHTVSTTFTIYGFQLGTDSAGSNGSRNSEIQIAASFDTLNDLVIESKVPLHAFQIDPWASGSFSMGFEITSDNRMPNPVGLQNQLNQERQMQQNDNMPRLGGGEISGEQHKAGGMPERGAGMKHNDGPPSGLNDRDQSKTYKIWHNFSLAQQK